MINGGVDNVVVFEKCREWGITLSERKYQFGEEVKFAGYILNQIGHRPDPEKVAAIRDFPSPKDRAFHTHSDLLGDLVKLSLYPTDQKSKIAAKSTASDGGSKSA